MEEVKRYYDSPVSLADAEQYIAASFMTTAREYVAIGYWLRRIRDDKLFLEEGYKNFEEYVRHKYHRDPGWASNCIKVNGKFSIDGNSPYLEEQYRDYNKSQLVELAYMTEEQRMEVGPDMSVKAMKEMRKQEQTEAEKVVTSQLLDQAPSEQEPINQPTEKVVMSQPPERIILHFTDGDLSIDNAYGAMIAEIVKAYLAERYSSLEKECEVTALGWTYKVLKRPEVTVFYTEAGETFFDVENSRLEKEYQHWHGNKKDAAIKQQNEENAAKVQQEELSPIERGCITGLSLHGNCVCCGVDGVKCCGQCDEDCNGRCGWLGKPETKQPVPKIEHELRGIYCDAAARKLIESKHEWFAADHMNRVLQVNESEKRLKEQLAEKEAWYFADPCGNGIAHMNLFQDYIQFFDGDSWVGDCEWFYLCAAIQGMWNVIAIENIQAELHEKENKPELCKEEPQMEPETDQPNKVVDAEFSEIEEPARYDKDIMKEMIHQEEQMLSEMGADWKKRKPYYYTKHTMMLEAYRMLQMAREMEGKKNGIVYSSNI